MFPLRIQFAKCFFHNHTPRPGACPFLKHPVRFGAILNTSYKALFCPLMISRKKKGELIKTIQILVKSFEEIFASRISIFSQWTLN